jgi:glutamate-5-semialdehyde dehydrogenase
MKKIWFGLKSFLDYKIVIGTTNSDEAIQRLINIVVNFGFHNYRKQRNRLQQFMDNVWFCRGYVPQALLPDSQMGQFGLGGELAISTDKLHQRGPIGLQHLSNQ